MGDWKIGRLGNALFILLISRFPSLPIFSALSASPAVNPLLLMSWLQLDPQNLVGRARDGGAQAPSLATSLWRGIVGFMLVSLAGFAPWVVGGTWLYNHFGEFSVYVICAFSFVLFSGLMLHRLIIGPGSFVRFYKLFGAAFGVYAATWIFCWMMIAGETGCLIGLLAGTVFMGLILAHAFEATRSTIFIVAALSLNLLGYYGGSWIEGLVTRRQDFKLWLIAHGVSHPAMIAQLSWGAVYGISFGVGLGLAFYFCQAQARALLNDKEAKD